MIHKFVRYQVRKESLADALTLVRAFVDEVNRKEGGTATYIAYQEKDDPTRFYHTMAFRTPSAEEYHRKTSWCKKFVEGLHPLCSEPPAFTDVTPIEKA